MKGAYIMPSIALAITPAIGIAIVVFLIIAVMIVGIAIRASSEADMLPEPVLCTKKSPGRGTHRNETRPIRHDQNHGEGE